MVVDVDFLSLLRRGVAVVLPRRLAVLSSVTCRGKLLSLLFDVGVLLLITTGTPHSHIRAYGPSAITHGILSLMHSG